MYSFSYLEPVCCSGPGKSKWLAEGNLKKCPKKVIQFATRMQLSGPACVSIHSCVCAKSLQSCLLSMGVSRQEYWSGLPCPPPWDLPDQKLNPRFLQLPHWQAGSLLPAPPGKPLSAHTVLFPPLINTWLVSPLSVSVGVLFCKAKKPGPCHWLLA